MTHKFSWVHRNTETQETLKRKVITETHAKSNQLIAYRINAVKACVF